MIEILKHFEFLNPFIKDELHVIGVGAIGSHIIELLIRLGFQKIYIYDMDTVEPINIANQMYFYKDIDLEKTKATMNNGLMINPSVVLVDKGKYTNQRLTGYVFLALDNIELRKSICESLLASNNIKGIFDFRMRLTDAQHYATLWNTIPERQKFIQTMDFSQAEADENTPVSACNTSLSIIPTIKIITSLGIANFINLLNGKALKKLILIDAFSFTIHSF